MSTEIEFSVYTSSDICRLYDCGKNEIPQLIERGLIPKPLPSKAAPGSRQVRKWAPGVIHKHLAIDPGLEDRIRKIVAEMLQTYSERQSA